MATRTQRKQTKSKLDGFVAAVDDARAYLHQLGFGAPPTAPRPHTARLDALRQAMVQARQRDLSEAGFIEEFAQAMACGRIATRGIAGSNEVTRSQLAAVASPLIAACLDEAVAASPPEADARVEADDAWDAVELAGLYEPYLGQHHRQRRSSQGVYYTPKRLAQFVVRQVDALLCEEFRLTDGLADTATWSDIVAQYPRLSFPTGIDVETPFVRILDPAVGGGVFLAAVIEQVHATMRAKWKSAQSTPDEITAAWQQYVPQHVLPRLCGLELMLPAAVVAHWQVFQTLSNTGYEFRGDERIRILLADTLGDWDDRDRDSTANPCSSVSNSPSPQRQTAHAAHAATRQEPFSVILGNPPFSGISRNNGRWIKQLLRGGSGEDPLNGSYYRANGEPLAEKKLWLQDDYVKFLRYAQWRIESTGAGIVGFVTNHGYLDNVTFRGMREQLTAAFPRITVLDLHGNTKKKERAPGGQPDENIFGIESGVAVGLLRKPPAPLPPRVSFGELWGSRDEKLARLAGDVPPPWQVVAPVAPYHFFTPCLNKTGDEYEWGIPLTDVMPVNSTVAVTARDRFVVAFDRDELLERMATFRDLTISDEEIRARFFSNTRSTRYAAGDTRGWKLTAARQRMADDPDWQSHLRPCLYRPFDRRWIYWTDWMVDWPRTEVNQHFAANDNLALIARRQMLPTQPCNFFWVSRDIPMDGVIRSDNRGSESAFPLFLTKGTGESSRSRSPNLSEPFIAAIARVTACPWQAEQSHPASDVACGPLDAFNYIYGQFHSTEFRERYADWLRIDFPRVFLPRTAELFWQLSQMGAALVAAHTALDHVRGVGREPCQPVGQAIESGFPRYASDRIALHDQLAIDNVSRDVWEFRAGGHQVCQKWWRDRRERLFTAADVAAYRQLVASVQTTLATAKRIDECIATHGGWPDAFRDRGPDGGPIPAKST